MIKGVLSKLLVVACMSVLIMGCESSSDSPSGSGVIEGNLNSVARQAAPGAVSGITVELTGPVNRLVTTGADGSFRFENLPAGSYELIFHIEGKEVREPVTLEEAGMVVLALVSVNSDGSVTVSQQKSQPKVTEEEEEETPVVETAPAPAAPALDVGGSWIFSWTSSDSLQLTQGKNGGLTGTMGSYTVAGSITGNKVKLSFTPGAPGVVPSVIIKSATGTASELAPVADGPPWAWSMSGTWKGTEGESGSWHAYRPR